MEEKLKEQIEALEQAAKEGRIKLDEVGQAAIDDAKKYGRPGGKDPAARSLEIIEILYGRIPPGGAPPKKRSFLGK
jgi:cell division septum initiation protein DivIVA